MEAKQGNIMSLEKLINDNQTCRFIADRSDFFGLKQKSRENIRMIFGLKLFFL